MLPLWKNRAHGLRLQKRRASTEECRLQEQQEPQNKIDSSGGGEDSKSTPVEIHAAVEDENRPKSSKSSGDKLSYEKLLEFQQLVQGFININVAK